jgi:hypothetical protein
MKAHVRMHNGTPTLFLDGQPSYAAFHMTNIPSDSDQVIPAQHVVKGYSDAGVHLYSTDVVGREWSGPRPGNPSHYDFTQVADRYQKFIDVDPDAHFLLRMGFETRWQPGNWWNKLYPEECLRTDDGVIQTQSLASTLWRQQVKDFLRAYIAHLKTVGVYDRVIAFQIAAGSAGEWIESWSSMMDVTGDYSEPMRRHFRGWLRTRYGNDPVKLQAAWNDPAVSFETAEVPPAPKQFNAVHYLFRDPKTERAVIDYYECFAELAADDLIDLCRFVKDETGGDKLTGAFFGYLMDIAWNSNFFSDFNPKDPAHEHLWAGGDYSTYQRSGHLGLHRVLRSPHIDFLVSPYSYGFRGIGGDGLPMQPNESLRVNGKIYLMEEDTRMHNNFDPGGRMHPPKTTMAVYRRNFAQVVTRGLGITWMHDAATMDDFPEQRADWWPLLKRTQEIGRWSIGLDRAPCAEVGVFLDSESFYYQSLRNNIDLPLISWQKTTSLNRIGAQHDIYLLDDLLDGGLPEYKLYVFLNPWHLDRGRRDKLARIVKRGGKTALWLYAAGLVTDDDISTQAMENLTGFRLEMKGNPWSARMHVTDFDHEITRGIPQDMFWGTTARLYPLFGIDDPAARILGQVVSAQGRSKPGLGVKELKDWRSVYCATPDIPGAVLRGVARMAGVHLYSEAGDVLYNTRDLLAVHTVGGGERTFRLPRTVQIVQDLYAGKPVARNTDAFTVRMEPATSELYFTGDEAALRGLGD